MKRNLSTMRKIFIILTALFAIATQSMAQKFIDVYQKGKVAGCFFSADIDSISISGTDSSSRRIHFWRAGNLSNSFVVIDVDSIKVFRTEDEPLVYLGILGFNQALYPKPIDILASSTSSIYTSFINNLYRKDGTLLYYGVDNALDMLTQYNFVTPLSSVNLITFTDGLDQGSLMMTTKYQDESEYLSYLSRRIGSTRVRGLPLTAYCLGLRGNDVTNYSQFQANLRQLATSVEKAIEVSSMSDVQNRLNEIADQIISISNRQTISMKIPGQSNGTRVRFTFDYESPESSKMYIEGTFNLSDRSLRDVTYHGIRSTSGSMVMGVQDGIFVTYTFTGLQRTDGNGLIPTNNIHQYNMAKGSTTWQVNSEFTPGNNTQTTVTHSGAAIMLVLDCSSSLGSQFSSMQSYAKNFISRVANNAANFSINAPTNVTASMDDKEMAVNVSWDAVKYAEYYSVYRSSSSSSGFTKVADSLTVTSWLDETPLNGSNYYRIYAMGHGLTSQASSTSNVVNVVRPLCPDDHHPHLIDLGLPSGTKWACCNVDTDHPENQSPTNYGGYYAWGETETKSTYSWSTYTHYDGSSSTCHNLGSDIAGTQYDVAHVKWGGSWVMPSKELRDELKSNCTYEWTTVNGVKGGKFTSKINGSSIFLPAAGYRNDSGLCSAGTYGGYWSSTQSPSGTNYAYGLYFYSSGTYAGSRSRYNGRSVRPVVRN